MRTTHEAYLIGVQAVSEVASGLTDVQLVVENDPAAPAPPLAPSRLITRGGSQEVVITDRTRRWDAHREGHTSFQSRQLESLSGLDAGPAMASRPAASPTTVMVGDMLSINVPDSNGGVCVRPTAITAEVKHIGIKAVWVVGRQTDSRLQVQSYWVIREP